MLNRRRIISTLMISSILLSPMHFNTQVFAQNTNFRNGAIIEANLRSKIERKINTQKMMHDVQKLAIDDNARVAGFYGEKDAADYLVDEFEKFGMNAQIEEFELGRTARLELSDLSINGDDYTVKAFPNSKTIDTNLIG